MAGLPTGGSARRPARARAAAGGGGAGDKLISRDAGARPGQPMA